MGEKEVCLYKTILALSFCFFSLLTGAQITHPAEVAALNAVRRQLTDPLKFLDNWKKGDPCTWNWTGIICTDLDPVDGYLHIQELRLLKMNLSGTLAPELGDLKNVTILNFMWNQISGSIPKDVGNMTSLVFLLLSGNQITGPMPDELGFLQNLKKFQLDLNQISGPIPKTFAKLLKVEHFHMNDNQFSGQLPPEISVLPKLKHILLDNNRFTGYLPPELANMSSLTILQLDNNDFQGTGIPSSYANMPKLVKLSLVNCSLEGTIPDFSGIVTLTYLDLSRNQFTGNIPSNSLSSNITTIDLSNNEINGTIPSSFSGLPLLQKLSLENNSLSGSVPTTIWNNITFTPVTKLILDFQYNLLSDVSGSLDPPANVTVMLQGNPVCTSANRRNISQFCGSKTEDFGDEETSNDSTNTTTCPPHSCPTGDGYEFAPAYPDPCYCALPFGVEIRLRSPSISDFTPYRTKFETYLTSNLKLDLFQLGIVSIMWERGPRLRMFLKFFPPLSNTTKKFNLSEVERITGMFATFSINGSDVFGPYDLLNFTLSDVYSTVHIPHANAKTSKGLSGGGVAGIVLGVVFSIAILLCIKCCFFRKRSRPQQNVPTIKEAPKAGIKIEGVKEFAFEELELTTSSFSSEAQIGQGGYGKVYKGVLADGTVVAIKRATQSSLQSDREFYTEIELLSRLHHRNLVSLIGYCDKENEQMLVYEFMPLGSLHDLLSARYSGKLNFETRLHIALGAARGILYLHTEADPPIIHRDIKANNILLDSKFNAKVADFGISRLAPVPNAEGITTAYISTGVKGTPGYVDPQYLLTHTLNEKSDVYSLGIVFLELLTGMRPISHGRNIVQEVNAACQSGMMFSIIDRNMGGYPSECVKKFMGLSIRCTHDERKDRPSMLEVVRQLENIASMLPESEKKTYQLDVSNTGISGSVPSSVHPTTSYATYDGDGSDLVSGVIPTIKPR